MENGQVVGLHVKANEIVDWQTRIVLQDA